VFCAFPAEIPFDTIRLRVRAETDRLPSAIRSLEPAHPPYPVVVGDELEQGEVQLRDLDAGTQRLTKVADLSRELLRAHGSHRHG